MRTGRYIISIFFILPDVGMIPAMWNIMCFCVLLLVAYLECCLWDTKHCKYCFMDFGVYLKFTDKKEVIIQDHIECITFQRKCLCLIRGLGVVRKDKKQKTQVFWLTCKMSSSGNYILGSSFSWPISFPFMVNFLIILINRF